MNNINNTPFTKNEDDELASIFKKRDEQKKIEEEIRKAEELKIKEKQENYKTQQIISTTEAKINELYPDLPTINPKKSIGAKKIPSNTAKVLTNSSIILGKYVADEINSEYQKFKKETGLTICQLLIISTACFTGAATLLLDLPISCFIDYGIAPAIVAELIELVVSPKARQVYIDKFSDFFNSKETKNEHSGRRH